MVSFENKHITLWVSRQDKFQEFNPFFPSFPRIREKPGKNAGRRSKGS
jgi:hypothetical protein